MMIISREAREKSRFLKRKRKYEELFITDKFPFLKKTIAPNMRTCFYPLYQKNKKPLCDDHESILPIFSIQFIKNPLSTNQIYWSFAYKHTKLKKIYVL